MKENETHNDDHVSLFMPCLADIYYPAIGRATVKVLRRAGRRVSCPREQTCCGQWAYNLGRRQAAAKMALHFMRVFEGAGDIVCPSGSCVLMVRHYPELFEDPALQARARETAGRTYELTDYLVNRLGVTDLGARWDVKATIHDSCHPLRGLGLKEEPRALLSGVSGLRLVEMSDPETCCGFGGAFMGKYPALSGALAADKVDQALETGADILVLTEPGCLLNVDATLKTGNTGLRALHLAQVLARDSESGHD